MICEQRTVTAFEADILPELLREQPPTESRWLVVVVPPVTRPEERRIAFSSYSTPLPTSVHWVVAENEEDAIQKVPKPAGSRIHLVEARDVHSFDIPTEPAPVRIKL